jgi:hypothetical protein
MSSLVSSRSRGNAIGRSFVQDVELNGGDEGFAVYLNLEPLATLREAVGSLGVQAPALRHDGFRRNYDAQSSTVWYCSEGRWLALYGGD